MTEHDHIILRLKDVIVHTSIGLYDYEKHPEHPNRLKIGVDLHVSLPPGPAAAQPMIDYAVIYNYLRSIPSRGHIDLLETLADQITAQCFDMERVSACRISILKTTLLPDCAGAGIEVYRTRDGWMQPS